MKNIPFLLSVSVLLFIQSFSPSAFAQADSARKYLSLAADTGSIEYFNAFNKYYDKLGKDNKLTLIDNYTPYYYFLSLLFTYPPSVEIYQTFWKLDNILFFNPEACKAAENYFSYYIVNNMPEALNVLDRIEDKNIQMELYSAASVNEENEVRIWGYYVKNKLMDQIEHKVYFRNMMYKHYIEIIDRYNAMRKAEKTRDSLALINPPQQPAPETLPDSARKYLSLASETGSIEYFNKFAGYREKLDDKLVYDYTPYYNFLAILFTNRPSMEIFKAYMKVSEILNGNAEGGEVTAEYFSYYFTNNLPASLEVFESVEDGKLISDVFSEVDFVEKNIYRIQDYIKEHNLQKKTYYKYIKEYLF